MEFFRSLLDCAVTLSEGDNAYMVTAIDAAGNPARIDPVFTLDTTPPAITSFSPAATPLETLSVPVSGTASEALGQISATVSGPGYGPVVLPLTVASDGLSFSGSLTVPSYQTYQVTLAVRDIAGNTASFDNSVNFVQPMPAPPVVSTTQVDHTLTAQSMIQIPVQVQSTAAITVQILVNGAVVSTSNLKTFSTLVTLALGRNQIEIRATDSFGQAAIPVLLNDLVYDAPTPVAGPVGNSVAYPAQSFPNILSDALKDKLSLTTSLLARVTHRTDPVACVGGGPLEPPADPSFALLNIDPLTEATPEVVRLASQLRSVDEVFFFVRDQIEFLPRFGLTQTSAHTLDAGVGTAADKASALVTLLRAKNIPARFVAGDAWVEESVLKSLYGVQSARDLAWAQITSLKGYFQNLNPVFFDPEQMVVYHDGQRVWHIPHVWVQAYVPQSPTSSHWVQLDPTYAPKDRIFGGARLTADSRTLVDNFLFGGQSQFYTKDLSDFMLQAGQDSSQGVIELGLSVSPEYSIVPDGTISRVAPCIHAQAELLPDEYLFKSYARLGSVQSVLQGSRPLALAHAEPWGIKHVQDPDTNETIFQLRAGSTIYVSSLASNYSNINDLFHAIQEPARYGGAAESRTTPRIPLGLDTALSHEIAPTTPADYLRNVKAALDNPDTYAQMRLAGSLALLRSADQNRLINGLRNTSHAAQSLVATSVAGSGPSYDVSIGARPSQGQIDWLMSGSIYSRTGNSDDFNGYLNVAYAKGELVVANSSIEGQIWQDIYNVSRRAVSAVSVLQYVSNALLDPENNNATPGIQLVRGEKLNAVDNHSVFDQFKAEMQVQVPYISKYLNEEPYLFAITDRQGISFWNGTAYILIPSTPMGHAGAFLSNAGTAPILGGVLVSNRGDACHYTLGSRSFTQTCNVVESLYDENYGGPGVAFYSAFTQDSQLNGTCSPPVGTAEGACTGSNIDAGDSTDIISSFSCLISYSVGGNCNDCHYTTAYSFPNGQAETSGSCTSISVPPHTITIPLPQSFIASGIAAPPSMAPSLNIGTNSVPSGLGGVFATGTNGTSQNPNFTPNNSNTGGCPAKGQPVNPVSGAMWHRLVDFDVTGRTSPTALRLERNYLSNAATNSPQFGPHWSSNWDTRLFVGAVDLDPLHTDTGLPPLIWIDETGGPWTFLRASDQTLVAPAGLNATLVEYPDRFELTKKDGVKFLFTRQEPNAVAGLLKTIVEPHGERIDLGYTAQGQLETVTTALAGTARIARDPMSGLVTSVMRERDNLTYRYTYNADGLLASSSDFDGLTTSYEYNMGQIGTPAHGLLSAIQDPIGRRITFTYYSNGQAFEQTEPGNGYRAFFYSAAPLKRNYTRMTEIDGRMTEYRFNEVGQITDTVLPDGNRQSTEWDAQGNQIALRDETGYRRTFMYDSKGNPISYLAPGASVYTQVSYDGSFGKPVSVSHPNGMGEYFGLDPSTGDVTLHSVSGGGSFLQSFGIDAFGNVTTVNNGQATYGYGRDANGLLTTLPDLYNSESRTYDLRSRLLTRSFSSGRTLTFGYDTHDRVTSVSDTHGPTLAMTYDIVGRMLTRTVSDGTTSQVTNYGWDERDRLKTQTDALGRTTAYDYDRVWIGCNVVDLPSAITDPAGRRTRFEYDNRQRLIRKTDALGAVTRYDYNARGDLTGLTDALGSRTSFEYSPEGNLVARNRPSVVPDGNGGNTPVTERTVYSYDPEGHLIKQEAGAPGAPRTAVTEWTYNPLGRMTSRKVSWHYTDGSSEQVDDESSFSYEPVLEAQLLKTANNGNAQLSFTNELQPPFAQTAYSVQASQSGNPLGLIEDSFSLNRDATGEIASIIRASDPANALITAQHDPAARLTQMIGKLGAQSLTSTLAYDSYGRKRSVIHNTGMIGSFSYDLLNRTTSVAWTGSDGVAPQNFSEAITYGALTGNVDQITREIGVFNFGTDAVDEVTSLAYAGAKALPTGVVNRTIAYDLAHNRSGSTVVANTLLGDAAFTYQPDAMGFGTQTNRINKTTSRAETFAYRADQQLTSYDSGSETATTYARDALGRLVAKAITQGGSSFTQSFVYLGVESDPLLAKTGDGSTLLYLHGQGVNERLGHISSTGALAYTTDHIGSVLNTQAAGTAKIFGVFGEPLSTNAQISGTSDPVSYGWQGMQLDRESEQYHTHYRQYDPQSGRWTTPDPIFPLSGPNAFESMKNNPVLNIDPDGLDSIKFNRSQGTIAIYGNSGNLKGTFPAGNNVTRAVGSSPLVNGENYPVTAFKAHEPDPNGKFGPLGNMTIYTPGHTGVGIHAGRTGSGGPSARTEGCIRTNSAGSSAIFDSYLSNGINSVAVSDDPLEGIIP